MGTADLNQVRAFVAVQQAGSFSGAAQRLGVPRSTVSRAIAGLEESLGVLLFHRTTRKVAVTEAGRALYDRVVPSLASLEASLSEVPRREEVPSGRLRVTATADLGMVVLAEAVSRFTTRFPATEVEVHLSTAVVDLVREGFDLALRVAGGRLQDSSLVARKVGRLALRLYASPGYLARRGQPRTIEELRGHDWAAFRGAPARLGLSRAMGGAPPSPRVIADDMFFLREVLRTGGGVGALPTFLADADVASGALVGVLPRWELFSGTVYLVHPGRKHLPKRVTAFIELLVEQLRQRPLLSHP